MSPRRYPAVQPTSIRVPRDLMRWLEKQAEKEGRYVSVLIIRILEQWRAEQAKPTYQLPQFPTSEEPR